MNSLLLIGPEETALRRLKSAFIRGGFRVTALEVSEIEDNPTFKERFVLGIVDVSELHRWSDVFDRLRGKSAYQDLRWIVLVKESQVKELGAVRSIEDFCAVPVDLEMLQSRIRFVLGRLNHSVVGTGIHIGALHLDVDRYEVSLDKEPLELTYKEFELLKFLATHPGRVFSRDQLLNQVWGYDFIGGTRTVDVHIRRLRAKLGPKYASLIDTVRNVGYKFLESLK